MATYQTAVNALAKRKHAKTNSGTTPPVRSAESVNAATALDLIKVGPSASQMKTTVMN
jgi:hypothetical protein